MVAPATKASDAKTIGIPAAGGAVLGAVLGGKKGAAIGAAVGGGAGTAVVLTTAGKEVGLASGVDSVAHARQAVRREGSGRSQVGQLTRRGYRPDLNASPLELGAGDHPSPPAEVLIACLSPVHSATRYGRGHVEEETVLRSSRARLIAPRAVFGVVALFVASPSSPAGAQRGGVQCQLAGPIVRVPGLSEGSGLALSRRVPGRLWTHNDSGKPILFALDARGAVTGRIEVTGATVEDWEAIAVGPCGTGSCLYIGDIGDNNASRKRITIYRLPEPDGRQRHGRRCRRLSRNVSRRAARCRSAAHWRRRATAHRHQGRERPSGHLSVPERTEARHDGAARARRCAVVEAGRPIADHRRCRLSGWAMGRPPYAVQPDVLSCV